MSIKNPTLTQSLIPILVLMVLILINVLFVPDDTLSGANQLSLLISSAIACLIAYRNGVAWANIISGIVHTIVSAIPALIILLVIGMLSGMWMISGVVPAMIYYGLEILRPEYFLPAAVIISSIISVAVGSSWSTIATVGVALIGIGKALGFSEAIVAGAIVSGAYFGDKVSPLSDTTNLAAAIAGTSLFTHIKYMMLTTVPSMIITIIIFIVLSFTQSDISSSYSSSAIQNVLKDYYNINPLLFIVPMVTIFLIVKKIPAIPVLFIGALLGGVFAIIFQPEVLAKMAPDGNLSFLNVYAILTKGMYGATTVSTGDPNVDSLLSTGGMAGMLNTVWLIICAMILGGVLEAGHFLEKITSTVSAKVKSAGSLITATSSMAVLFNLTAGDQYMSIVIPGKMFAKLYRKMNLKSEVLSRTLEDSATVTSVLIPWNTCGATQASILGVATVTYAPFAFFCYISPIITIIYAWFNIKIARGDGTEPDKKDD